MMSKTLSMSMHCIAVIIIMGITQTLEFQVPEIQILTASDYRIGKSVIPVHYDIALKFASDLNETREFLVEKCIIKINLYQNFINETVEKIRLHSGGMRFSTDTVLLDKDNQSIAILTGPSNVITEILEITLLNQTLRIERQPYTIIFTNVTGIIRDDNQGIYLGNYKVGNETKIMVAAQFRPILARYGFPCFDEPIMKATFDLTLTVPRRFKTVIGNTRKIREEDIIGSDLKVINFERTLKISTYQVGFLLSTFQRDSSPDNPNFSVYCPEGNIQYTKFLTSITPKIIKGLENILEMNYTELGNPILNNIALPMTYIIGKESWSFLTYRDYSLYYDVNRSTNAEKQSIVEVAAHLMTHMWFGNLITVEWWSENWLSEGLAEYFECILADEVEPGLESADTYVVDRIQSVLEIDAIYHSQPLTSNETEVYNSSTIAQKWQDITYVKGVAFLRMVEHIISKPRFYAALRKYINKHKWGNVNPSHFFEALASEGFPSGKMLEWTEKSGYPVVTVKRVNNSALLSQTRFLIERRKSSTQWHIPISYASSTHNQNFKTLSPSYWIKPNEKLIIEGAFNDSPWIIVNVQQSGYYRVNYDQPLWSDIMVALNSENFGGIPSLTRAQLIDDVMNMARVMRQSYHLAMDVTKYLEHEVDYYPWFSAFKAFQYLLKRIGKKHALYTLLMRYIIDIGRKMATTTKNEYEPRATDTYTLIAKTAGTIDFLGESGDLGIIREAQKQFGLCKTDPKNYKSNINVQQTIFCYGIKNGTTQDWNFLYEQYKKSDFPAERKRMLEALGCSKEPAILRRYLEMTIDPKSEILKQEHVNIFKAVLKSNVDVAQQFFEDNIKEIGKYYASWNAMSFIVTELTDRFTTVHQIQEFKQFVDTYPEELKDAGGDAVYNQIKLAEANVKWLATFEDELTDWLTKELATRSDGVIIGSICLIVYIFVIFTIILQ